MRWLLVAMVVGGCGSDRPADAPDASPSPSLTVVVEVGNCAIIENDSDVTITVGAISVSGSRYSSDVWVGYGAGGNHPTWNFAWPHGIRDGDSGTVRFDGTGDAEYVGGGSTGFIAHPDQAQTVEITTVECHSNLPDAGAPPP